MQRRSLVLSSASALYSFMGHSYNYHSAVKDALQLDSIDYKVLIPRRNPITSGNAMWVAELGTSAMLISQFDLKTVRFFYYVYDAVVISFSWLRFYKVNSKVHSTFIFFETGGNFLDEMLISFVLKLFSFKKPEKVWYLIRGLPSSKKFQYILKLSIVAAQFLAGKNKLIVLTDTLPLKESLTLFLKREVSCVAIPHGLTASLGSRKVIVPPQKKSITRIWGVSCLGQNKGEDYLASLLKNINLVFPIQVLVRDVFLYRNQIDENQVIFRIGDNLSERDYIKNLQSCSVALLPYFGGNNQQYHLSSSGIFVDCLAAGVLPLVSKGTWMETELKRFCLEELIVNWDKYNNFYDLLKLIQSLLKSQETINKLNNMRSNYCNLHSPSGFLKSLYESGCLCENQV